MGNKQKALTNMIDNPSISVITLNVNGLKAPVKRQRLSEWIKKQDPVRCCLQEPHFKYKDTQRLKVNEWRKTYYINTNQKKAEQTSKQGKLPRIKKGIT